MTKVVIINYPGSVGAADAERAFAECLGCAVSFASESDEILPEADLIVLPGGYSYGDHLRPGAFAARSPVSGPIRKAVRDGRRVLGIGNGFQILCEMGLLPGALLRNEQGLFINQEAYLTVEDRKNPFTEKIPEDKVLRLPVAHYFGRYWADKRTIQDLEENAQIIFRYADVYGEPDYDRGLNGSISAIAGIMNRQRNVLGLMPHPERAVESAFGLGGTDGLELIKNMV